MTTIDDRQHPVKPEYDTSTTAGHHIQLATYLLDWKNFENGRDAEEITADALMSIAHSLVALNDTLDAIRHHLVEGP